MGEYRVPVVACVGAGQLARMLQSEASELGVQLRVLANGPDDCAAFVCPQTVVGQPTDTAALAQLLEGADALTVEHELIPDAVFQAAAAAGVPVHPSRDALLFAKDKLAMRPGRAAWDADGPSRWLSHGATLLGIQAAVAALGDQAGWPLIAKVSHGGYDGRGVAQVGSLAEFQDWKAGLEPGEDGGPRPCLVEERVPFTRELAVMVARRPSGNMQAWPAVQTWQEEGQCAAVLAPAPDLEPAVAAAAVELALQIGAELRITGVFAVEMFLVEAPGATSGSGPVTGARLYINELAMRPHNSGHWTQDGCVTSQFEQHLRAVLDLPLGETKTLAPFTAMGNILGSAHEDPGVVTAQVMQEYPQAKVHLYRKGNRPKRKIGHVNVTAFSAQEALTAARQAADAFMGK